MATAIITGERAQLKQRLAMEALRVLELR